ncbi:MAG TPA: carboxylesterase family protein, partial [Gammaproteobacteria bacterium]|nr:carboxylesterase family protein [Gammaproteobacteria bacterium]
NASEFSFAAPRGPGGGGAAPGRAPSGNAAAGQAGPGNGAAGRGGPGNGAAGRGGPGSGAAGRQAGGGPAAAANGSDRLFWTARRVAEYERAAGRNGYVYWFTQKSPAPEGKEPSLPVHASEVKYVFDNLGQQPLFPDASDAKLAAASQADQRLADTIASYWVNFARTGNPNGKGLPEWPAHSGLDSVNAAILDANPASEKLPTLEQMKSYDAELQQQLEPLLKQ